MLDQIRQHREEILAIAARFGATDVRVFGSVARNESGPDSDIDFVVRFKADASLFDRGGMWTELHELLGRDIDLVDESLLRDEVRDDVLSDAIAV